MPAHSTSARTGPLPLPLPLPAFDSRSAPLTITSRRQLICFNRQFEEHREREGERERTLHEFAARPKDDDRMKSRLSPLLILIEALLLLAAAAARADDAAIEERGVDIMSDGVR